jgi:beta-galactosidase GanA
VDGNAHTVLMIQVENEVGIVGDSRDRSAAANEAFQQPVPKQLMDYLDQHKDSLMPEFRTRWEAGGFKTTGSWEDIFGASEWTDQMFMAWNYARYVGLVAAAGKAEYPLPMYVNTWLPDWQQRARLKPGTYPSGGAAPEVMDVWKAGAPQIDILSPDTYSVAHRITAPTIRCSFLNWPGIPERAAPFSTGLDNTMPSVSHRLEWKACRIFPKNLARPMRFSRRSPRCFWKTRAKA